jgi:hypothetical protein
VASQAIAAELAAPVGQEDGAVLHVMGSQPQEYQDHEGDTVGAVESMAVGQEAVASTSVAGGPPVAEEAPSEQVVFLCVPRAWVSRMYLTSVCMRE